MKKIFAIMALALALAAPAHADNFETVPSIYGVFDTTTGTLYGITPPGQSNVSVLPILQSNGGLSIGTTAAAPTNGLQVLGNANVGSLTIGSTTLLATSVALTNGAASATGTLTNGPAAGNPTKWIPINDNGTTRYIPAW